MKKRKLTLKRLDPWSVLKFGLVANTVGLAILLVASRIVWYFITRLDLIGQVCETAGKVAVDLESCGIDGGALFKQVLLVGVMGVVVATGVQVFVAFLYNLIADLTGGLTFTFFDDSIGDGGAMTARGGSVAAPTGAGDPSIAREERLREAAQREEQRRSTRTGRTSRDATGGSRPTATSGASTAATTAGSAAAAAAAATTTTRSERLKQELTGQRSAPTPGETSTPASTPSRPAQETTRTMPAATPQRPSQPSSTPASAAPQRPSQPSPTPASATPRTESAPRPSTPSEPSSGAPTSGGSSADARPERTRTYERSAEPRTDDQAPKPAEPRPESRPEPRREGDDDPIFGSRT